MSQVIISNDVQDYQDCRDVVLRNRHGFVIGTIVDIENHFIVNDGRNKVVFVLDNGKKVFAEFTRLAKKKFIASQKMVKSHADSAMADNLPLRKLTTILTLSVALSIVMVCSLVLLFLVVSMISASSLRSLVG
jgi:hypothetical protein